VRTRLDIWKWSISDGAGDEGDMKRLVIFTVLFPPLALVVFIIPDVPRCVRGYRV